MSTKRTTKQPEEKSNKLKQEKITPEVISDVIDETVQQQNNGNSLEDDFAEFERAASSFTPEQEKIVTPNSNNSSTNNPQPGSVEYNTKVRMFAGFCCFILSGLNTFLLNKIKKSNVPFDKMTLTDTELDSVCVYLDSPEIVEFINKLPVWLIGIAHIEYMFYQKHAMLADDYKIIQSPKKKESDKKEEH